MVVKEIETKIERSDSKCFQVGEKFEKKDMLYENSFWPTGLAFRRYKFNFSNHGTSSKIFRNTRKSKKQNAIKTIQNNNIHKLSVLHQNIQSIKNKTVDIEIFINSMEKTPEVLCFTEHFLYGTETLHIKNYNLTSTFSRTVTKHGGSCIYTLQN